MQITDACRVCLATDRLLFPINNIDLVTFYSQLTNIAFEVADGRPKRLCFECLHNLRKSKGFRDKCLRGENVLNQLITSDGMTQQPLSTKFRTTHKLSSQLCNAVMRITSFIPCDIESEEESNVQMGIKLKVEYDCDVETYKDEEINTPSLKIECDEVKEDTLAAQSNLAGEHLVEIKSESDNVVENSDSDEGMSLQDLIDSERETTSRNIEDNEYPLTVEIHVPPNPIINETCSIKSTLEANKKDRTFACKVCPYTARKKNYLTRHSRIHVGEKPYACDFCPYTTTNKSALNIHCRNHTGEKPFACSFCPYKTTDRRYLTIHNRTHTGVKPYACEFCTYKSKNKSDLSKHYRIHSGEKPFACIYCTYTSTNKSALNIHSRKHTGERPFACDTCPYKATNRSDLTKHCRRHTAKASKQEDVTTNNTEPAK